MAAKSGSAIERAFPIVEVSQVAEQESWRKEINRPLYHIHKWWATRLGSVFRAITLSALTGPATDIWKSFYKTHDFSDKIVLDPFMGSGTTLGESLKLGARAVGCDINPVSTFLVRQAFTHVSEHDLRNVYSQLERTVAPAIRRYYQTVDPDTGESIPVLYYFWVKLVVTPDGEEVPLFSRYVFAQDAYPRKKPRAQLVCRSCWGIFEGRFDATDVICPHCHHRFDPQQGPTSGQSVTARSGACYRIKDLLPRDGKPMSHRLFACLALRADGSKVYLPARKLDVSLFEEAEVRLRTENLPLPTLSVRPGHNTDQARGYNYLRWRDFFNARQLLCLGLLLKEILAIPERGIQEQMLCLFSSTLEFNNLFCSFKGEGTGAVRHMFSNHILKPERTPLENSVWGTSSSSGTFSSLFESRLIRAKRYLDEPFEIEIAAPRTGVVGRGSTKVLASSPIDAALVDSWQELCSTDKSLLVMNGDSSRLPIPDGAVDAVVTDPPYFDFVHYSELSDFFFAWLSPVLKSRYAWFDRVDSSDQGEVQQKDPRAFASQLGLVFAECCRVLKDNGVLAFSFHHSRPDGWAAIYEAVSKAGFAVVAAHPVHGEIRGSSPKNAAKSPISLDAVLVCRKRSRTLLPDHDLEIARERTSKLWETLRSAGMTLSAADRSVILASQILVSLGSASFNFDEVSALIEEAWSKAASDDLAQSNRREAAAA